ncbi:endonuclease domain-containing protein [Novosphingobium cyanobacteriorum]|uniref:Endonuclease domain-containing protein n=1 Tax=Novosphingobium cyanobacteriorum TaxID=3024215 RepID=A0ABT6CHU1_9SPHN|nr:endonuclease domain-containing protein [Novosphingobium cyanobacteriorum]MDF8332853.1 endonuclease domain-containing protein [Novosphingobium cyanobacteriorum]
MLHGPKGTQQLAAGMRQAMSLPEVLLWRQLRFRPEGLKFRRQHPAGRYVLDFFCAEARLAIEIEGHAHNTGDWPERDRVRTLWLEKQGIRVLRIAAARVLQDPVGTAEAIAQYAQYGRPEHPPLQGEGDRP